MYLKKLSSLLAFLFLITTLNAQFGYGYTINNDIYHLLTNPESDNANRYGSAGSALLNVGVGPKIWVGGQSFSLSVEATPQIGFLGLATNDYKGLGTFKLPIVANFNFKGLSGFDNEMRAGFLLGGGIQYNRTELYGLDDDYGEDGVSRKLFQTYVVQAGYGFGIQGFGMTVVGRYGFNPDTKANNLSLGFQWDFNVPSLKKIKNKASSL